MSQVAGANETTPCPANRTGRRSRILAYRSMTGFAVCGV